METEIGIGGMTCGGCVNSVKNVLQKIPGVTSVDVSLDRGIARVQYDAAKTDTSQFREAIKNAGFEVTG
jgi:copper chaperone